ncbi:hypothetical protein HYH02_004385 [Chlamydomonas schloesseri]|uniref:Uncharacterized protein n=1 Tax=Chlamydomonas schloesseri TaxID=2026947 RepID=A0A836B8S6_9CHLO|nr:hypothetical protein HYH02_004385 [Chlamydomonas schloesseri]|eukprot:KAG2451117.1 hypothetical protein HYH02_004385 [Chlamydomonas schloesseri]
MRTRRILIGGLGALLLALATYASSTIGADINVSGYGTCSATYTYTAHPLITELLRIQSGTTSSSSSTSGGSSATSAATAVTPAQALQDSCSGSTRVTFQDVAESVCADAPVAGCARGGYTMTFSRASSDCVAQLTPVISSNSAVQLRLVASGATCTTTFSVGSHPLLEQLQQSGALPGVGRNGGAAATAQASHMLLLVVLLVSALCMLL